MGPLPQATRARCPLPGPDFHRQVPAYPRHTVRYLFISPARTCTTRTSRATWGVAWGVAWGATSAVTSPVTSAVGTGLGRRSAWMNCPSLLQNSGVGRPAFRQRAIMSRYRCPPSRRSAPGTSGRRSAGCEGWRRGQAQRKALIAISRARTLFVACGRESESEIVEFHGVARAKVVGTFLLLLTPYCIIAGWHQFTSCAFVLSSSLRSLQSGRAWSRARQKAGR